MVDYGCGAGHLLREVSQVGWKAIGVEFDQKVAEEISNRTGARVITSTDKLAGETLADVLHLGDVIEHLTEVKKQMPQILRLLKPGGLLLAHGPLENNTNLFTLLLRWSRSIRN